MTEKRRDVVRHMGFTPAGLRQAEAAAYVGFSVKEFMQMVEDGSMPKPKRRGEAKVWLRQQLETHLAALPDEGSEQYNSPNPWDSELGDALEGQA